MIVTMVNEVQLIGAAYLISGCIFLVFYSRFISFIRSRFGFSWRTYIVGLLIFVVGFSVVGVTYIFHQYVKWYPLSIDYLYMLEALILGIYIELIRYFFFKFLIREYSVAKEYTLGLGFMSPYFLLFVGGGVFGITLILNPSGVGFSRYVWAHFILTPLGFLEQLVLQIFLSMLILKTLKDSQYKNMIYAIGLHAFTDFVKRYGMGFIIYDLLPIRLMSPYQDPWFIPGIQTYLAEFVLLMTSITIGYHLVKQYRGLSAQTSDTL